jgi:NAD(P)-dependent dehydrogenase (short-subunit alcohol dehydrogenase family)
MAELMCVRDKVCIITGSAAGLGKAYAEILLENGARVCLSDVNEVNGKETLDEFSKTFGKENVHFVPCDVTNQDQFSTLFDEAEKYFKSKVELLVNNAGINPSVLGWRKCMDVNIYGVMIGMEIALERMTKSSSKGTIINCASLAGFVTGTTGLTDGAASYYASKHACVALSRDTATEFKNNKVVVKCLCPAYANTAIIKLNDPEEQANFDKKINEIGVMEPRDVAVAFYKLVTQCQNGSVMAVIKDYPVYLIPDYGMIMVLGLGLISKIANKLSGGLEVVKPIHQLLCLLIFMILLLCFAGWML